MNMTFLTGRPGGDIGIVPLATVACLICQLALASTPFRDCPACPVLVAVPSGTFEMGEDAPDSDASPRHRVTIAHQFAIGIYEITRTEFEDFIRAANYAPNADCNVYETGSWFVSQSADWRYPGFAQTGDDPVVCITWLDTREYLEWLSSVSGYEYRLPSEAEWEYVATIGAIDGSDDFISHDFANYGAAECCGPATNGNDQWQHTAPVGSFMADGFGLHDVRGNVWEWLGDCYHHNYENAPSNGRAQDADCSNPERRVVRGGGWGDAESLLRRTYRLRAPDDSSYFTLGFRVARDME